MTQNNDNPHQLAFSSQCVPGSEAEQKEKERIAAFLRDKARRHSEGEADRTEAEARRQQAYQAADDANRARMRQHKASRTSYGGVPMPRQSLTAEMNQD